MPDNMQTNPRINRTDYSCYPTTGRGTINTGTTLNCAYSGIGKATEVMITNFDTSNDLLVRLNFTTGHYIVIKSSSTITLNREKITRVYLTNNSGSAIEFQVVLLGG